jgi:hypothetical protein
MVRTLSLAASTSFTVAGGPLRPGIVPKIYWSFSPSVLIIWLNPSSSMAMDTRIWLMASSRVKSGSKTGNLGSDMILLPP